MTKEELKNKCTERAKIFQQAIESCKSSNPIDCIEWFADRIADLEKENERLTVSYETLKLHDEEEIGMLKSKNAELKIRVENQKSFLERIRAKFELGKIDRKEIEGYLESEQLTKAKEIILKLYNAGRDVLMCRAEEKAYDNLSNAINDKSIEQFISEVEK